MSVLVWNLEWAKPGSDVERRIVDVLVAATPDVIVLTEASTESVPEGGHVVTARGSWGYEPRAGSHRKVVMWSRHPWTEVIDEGSDDMPPGRFVVGVTDTPIGEIRVVGVCIPWRDAHVRTGAKNRRPWQDHLAYLGGLGPILSSFTGPCIVAGDFNQRIPRRSVPVPVHESLLGTLGDFSIATESSGEEALIDHVAVSRHLKGQLGEVISNIDSTGRLSDHRGAIVPIRRI